MKNFDFMLFLLVFLVIRNVISILASFCILLNVKNKLNLTCKELNFKLYLLFLINVMILWVDMDKINENKLGFGFLLLLIYSVVKYMRIVVENSIRYLFENNIEENNNNVE